MPSKIISASSGSMPISSMTSHCGLLFLILPVLCLEIIDLTLFMQL